MKVKVSVIMPVYNGVDFLKLSIDSILSQTFKDFEFIILDDGSTDGSWRMVQRYARADSRIKLLKNAMNLGLIDTLNLLLDAATGELIARQDQDDISAKDRLEHQVSFMDLHPEVGLLGTAFHQIDMAGNMLETTRQPESDTQIRWKILFANPFAHTSVMFRSSLVTMYGLRYSHDYPHSEDYELWVRMLDHTRAANLALPLVSWRRNVKGISQTHTEEQNRNWKGLAAMQLNRLLTQPVSEDETVSYFCLYTHRPPRKEELPRLLKFPQILSNFSNRQDIMLDAGELAKVRKSMVNGLLVSLFNGLSSYRYYRDLGVYRLLGGLFWLEPLGVILFVSRKVINFIKKKFI